MHKQTIGLIAAMPEEIRPLLKRFAPVAREKLAGFNVYTFRAGEREACLIESGMGLKNAAAATHALIAKANPEIILNFGFAGAVKTGPAVGDVVVATRVLFHHDRLFSEQQGISAELAEQGVNTLEDTLLAGNFHIYRGTFITTGQIKGKRELSKLLPGGASHPVLEMETSAVAQMAAKGKTPLLAARAISDGAEEELGFTIDEFTDRAMRIRTWKVLWTIGKKPWIIPQLVRLARNSRIAGENLSAAVANLMERL